MDNDIKEIRLKLYNTETREKVEVYPSNDQFIRLYTCGPTVYDYAHIGNFRTYVFEDLLRRTLKFFGLKVEQVMNITDVDDKTIRGAIEKKVSLKEYTEVYETAFFEDLDQLNIERAEKYPHATDFIEDMIEMILSLIDKGYAYQGTDGNVYYSIDKFSSYGRLAHLKTKDLKAGASERVALDEYDKENVSDFVLWKNYNPERDGKIYWESPFGQGRPGWHIECSSMALKLLGKTIDIHCGGVDNIFPHHENEIAQSEAFTGRTFSHIWAHAEHLIVNGKKMSKSLGNFYTLRDLLKKGYTPEQVRYTLLATHYRTQLNFTFEGLDGAKNALDRLNDFMMRLREIEDASTYNAAAPILDDCEFRFASNLADDLNISASLAALFDLVRKVNTLIDEKQIGKEEATKVLNAIHHWNTVLGLPLEKEVEVPQGILDALEQRQMARKERNFQKADELRDWIIDQGYVIEDTPQGPRVKQSKA